MQDNDVGAVLKGLESFDLAECGLVIVNFLEGDDEVVRQAAAFVDV